MKTIWDCDFIKGWFRLPGLGILANMLIPSSPMKNGDRVLLDNSLYHTKTQYGMLLDHTPIRNHTVSLDSSTLRTVTIRGNHPTHTDKA